MGTSIPESKLHPMLKPTVISIPIAGTDLHRGCNFYISFQETAVIFSPIGGTDFTAGMSKLHPMLKATVIPIPIAGTEIQSTAR